MSRGSKDKGGTESERERAIGLAVSAIEKQFGKGAIMRPARDRRAGTAASGRRARCRRPGDPA